MGINEATARKVIANNGRNYYTKNGNVYKAIRVFDENGKIHGYIVYTIHPDKEEIGKQYMCFISRIGKGNKSVNKWTCKKIKEFEGNYYYTKNAKYRAFSLYSSNGTYHGFVVYKYTPKRTECVDFIPCVEKDIKL